MIQPSGDNRETYADLHIEPRPMRPHILAAATIVYGDDYYGGPRETVSLSGMVEINKWPMEGFEHRIRPDGSAEFNIELISRADVGIKGFSYYLNDRIQVLSHPDFPNSGSISQIVPGRNFPARFTLNRHGVIQTSSMRLVHRNVIRIEGVVDSIPPYKVPLTPPLAGHPGLGRGGAVVKNVNVVGGVNLPEAWSPADEQLSPLPPIVAFFDERPADCTSLLTRPTHVLQSSAEGAVVVRVGSETEHVNLHGDHRLAAGVELLVYDAEWHRRDDSVQVQLARMALVGESALLGGRVMLRSSFFRVSHGPLGHGTERAYARLAFPAPLRLSTHLEMATPDGELQGVLPVVLAGELGERLPRGAVLATEAAAAPVPLVAYDGRKRAEIQAVSITLEDGMFGEEAFVEALTGAAGSAA